MRDVTDQFTAARPGVGGTTGAPESGKPPPADPSAEGAPPPAGGAPPLPPRDPDAAAREARAAGEQLLDLYLPLPVLVDLVVEYAAAQIQTSAEARTEYRRNTRRVMMEYGQGVKLDRALELCRLRNAPPLLVVGVGVIGLWQTAAAHARLYGAEVHPPSVRLRPDGLLGRGMAKIRGLAGRLFGWL